MNTTQIIIGVLASALGIYYAILGLTAIKHLRNADQVDKAVGWTLWWCLDVGRYAEEGRRLCKRGQMVAFASVALWIAVYVVEW